MPANIRLAPDFAASLRNTVERFNGFARGGVDEDFRRGETPIEITFHGPVPTTTTARTGSCSRSRGTVLITNDSGARHLDTKGGRG